MDKEIVIYRGDEHRAKMEKQFSEKDFFADVYSKAYRLVAEIENEMKAYRYEIEKERNRLVRYQGMGNNMIIFCGGRGQGKTSVMQSFAKCLDGTYKAARKDGRQGMLAFVSQIDCEKYEVVDSLDPSAMESGESILRVLISRLFFRLENDIKSDHCFTKDDRDFLQNKKDIVSLFKKCYENIDCIKSGKGSDCELDDLQKLSGMGSSARLKENLHDLIDKYLLMRSGSTGCGQKKCRYLVIPIDDADLVTKKLFRLCEDIRNYLSIPNVIILMAVDYEQLSHAIYQKYLKQYRVMREVNTFNEQDCHLMAAKYMEKVFPITHRIDLPQIDHLLEEGYERIQFDYRCLDSEGKYESGFVGMGLEQCGNLQEQLLRILYIRTGLIFLGQRQTMHPFLPRTLRELTHWVKMLYDMHPIRCDEDVYHLFQTLETTADKDKQEELEKRRTQLKENLQVVKQYFTSYWCEKYLDISVAARFQRLDSAGVKRAKSTRGSASEIVDHEVTGGVKFNREGYYWEAVHIYTTIFLNEWFMAALEKCTQFERIAQFVKAGVNLREYYMAGKRYHGRYHTMHFEIETGALRSVLPHEIEPTVATFLQNFCSVASNDNSTNNMDKCVREASVKTVTFDILKPIMVQLTEYSAITNQTDETGQTKSLPGEQISEEKTRQIRAPYLITIRNVIANYDVQSQLGSVVNIWYEEMNKSRELISLAKQSVKLYEIIQEKLVVPQCASWCKDEFMAVYDKATALDKEIFNIIFLCNKTNFMNYVQEESEALDKCIQTVRRNWEKIINNSSSKENPMFVEAVNLIDATLGEIGVELNKIWLDIDRLQLLAAYFEIVYEERWLNLIDSYNNLQHFRGNLQNQLLKLRNYSKGEKEGEPIEDAPEPGQESSTVDQGKD